MTQPKPRNSRSLQIVKKENLGSDKVLAISALTGTQIIG